MKTPLVVLAVVLLVGVVAAMPAASALPDPICHTDHPEPCELWDVALELARCLAQQGPCPH